jgi:hypothetical protein
MAKRNRDIPPKAFRRFTYWWYVAPQRIVSTPRLAAREHIRRDFHLAMKNRPFCALTAYALDDKEWEQNPEAQQALKQLTPRQQARIRSLAHSKWDTRIRWDWDTLLRTIADDQETFRNYYSDLPDKRAMSDGTRLRIIGHYSKKAIYLLGGGSHVRHTMRTACLKAGLLDERGRLPSPSLFSVNWWECRTRAEQRNAKLLTLHWFHHALRNLRDYRNNRPSLPWREECADTCRHVQQTLRKP